MDLFAYGGMVHCGSGGYGAIVRLASNIQFNSCNNGYNLSTGGTNNDGNWHQYVVTWDGTSQRKIYIDGVLKGTKTRNNVFRIQDTGLVLGRSFMDWDLGTTLNGSADELRLWKKRLTDSEVQTLYNIESNAPPTLSSSVPADNATGVALDSTIVLNFSENVDVESGNITILKSSDNSTVETIDVTGGQVTGSGTSQITITPSSDFSSLTEYYVLIDASAFDDSGSASYAGITSTTALSFTSTNPVPTLSSSVPADNATGVALDSTIVLNFSENVDAESGNITIKKTSDNSTVETIDVTGGQVAGSGTSQITITPSSDFDSGTEYYVLIDASAFDDSDSGSYAGISSTTAMSFTIDSLTDPTSDKDITGTIDVQNTLAKNTITEFTSTVNDRLRYLRLNRINDDFSKNDIKFNFDNSIISSLIRVIPVSNISVPDAIPKNWSVWSEGSVSISTIGDNNNSSSKDIDTHGLAFGIDTKLNNNDLLGFALQFNQSDTDIGTKGTGIDSKNYKLSVYRTKPLNDDNFIEGLLGIGLIENDLERKNGANTLTGSRNGNQIFGSLNYGKTFNNKDFNLTPLGRIDIGYTELDSYTEKGTDALSYGKQIIKSGLVSIGFELNDIIEFSNSSFKPFGIMEYGLDFSNSSDTKMNYVSDTPTIYNYAQGINSTHLLTTEVGFNYERTDNLELSGNYKRIQGNESEKTDTIKFGFNYRPERETEYAISLDGTNDLIAGFDISKNVNGFNLRFNANQSLSIQSDQEAEVSISRKY